MAATAARQDAPFEAAAPADDQRALLQRWMSLAAMQQRVIGALTGEIARTSGFVESEADGLSRRFQALALSARQQTARVDSLTGLAAGVEVDGRTVALQEITALLERALADVVGKIRLLSKDATTMVGTLDALDANLQRVESCIARIEGINRTTTMLALNARIEAERAGAAGAAFRVVANEVRELSTATHALAGTMTSELGAVTSGIRGGNASLKRVAAVDTTEDVRIQERLEHLLGALTRRNVSLEAIVADAAKEAGAISAAVGGLVTGIQFQDRTKQRLEHVVDTLRVVAEAVAETSRRTAQAVPGLAAPAAADGEWIKALLDRFTMSEVRERFVAQILEGRVLDEPAAPAGPSAEGSVELF